jgi:hypothetical protein
MGFTRKIQFWARRGGAAMSLAVALAVSGAVNAQTVAAPPSGSATATPDNAVLLTVFLRHDQSRPLSELNAQLAKQGFYKAFPPPGVEVVSWYVAMGIGQVITLRLPASRIQRSSIPRMTTRRLAWPSTKRVSRTACAGDAVIAPFSQFARKLHASVAAKRNALTHSAEISSSRSRPSSSLDG